MSQNLDEYFYDEFTHIFNQLIIACPRRYEVKSVPLSKHFCPLEYHTGKSIFGFCSNPLCRAQSRKVCDQCITCQTHLYEPGFDYKQILFEDQVNRILELYKNQQIRDIQSIQFVILIIQLQYGTNQSKKALSELQIFYRKLEYLCCQVYNMSTQEYIIQVDNKNLNLIQYLNENYKELESVKQEWILKLKGFEDGIDYNLVNNQIYDIQESHQKKNLLDVLRQIFESRIYRENLVSQDDQEIIERNIDIILKYALEELGQNKVQEAIQICDIMIENCKTNFQALIIKGMGFDKQCQYEEALQLFDQAILIKSDCYESYFRKGITFNHIKQYQQAIDQYKIALQYQPNIYQIYNKLCIIQLQEANYTKAHRTLKRVLLSIESNQIGPLAIKLSDKLKLLEQAIKNISVQINNNYNHFPPLQYFYLIEKQKYDKAIQQEPQYYFAYEIKASYLKQMNSKNYSEGEQLKNQSYNNLVYINQNDKGKNSIYSQVFFNQNQYEKQLFEHDIKIQLNLYQYGISLFNLGRLQESKSILESIKQNRIFINNSAILKYLGVIYMKLDQPNESLQMVNKAIDVDNTDLQSYKYKGKVLIMLSQYQKALETFQISQKLGSNPKSLLKYRGQILQETNKLDQAIEILDQYLKHNPLNKQCHLQKGIVYLKQQQYDAAIELFNKVIDMESNYYLGYQQKGIVLMKQYQFDESILNFEKSLELKPNDATNWKLKGISLLKLSRFQKQSKCLKEQYNLILKILKHRIIQVRELIFQIDKSIKQLDKYKNMLDKQSQLIKKNPQDLNNYIGKGNTLIMLQQFDKAIKIFEQAKIIDSERFELCCSIEYCYYKNSQDKDRIKCFQHLVHENITKLTDLKTYSSFLISIKEYQFAVIIYDILCEKYPDDQELLLYDKYQKKDLRKNKN